LFSHPEKKASVAVILVLGFLAGAVATPAGAKTIHVRAKNPNALENKIGRADAGDRLVVHKGTYRGPVEIDKRLRVVGKKKRGKRTRKPVIEIGCGTPTGVDVTADGVKLRRLKIRGAGFYTLDMSHIETGMARELRLIDRCDAEYGLNVFNSGPVQLLDNRASGGYIDAGLYVGGITNTDGGTLLIQGNESFGNNRGLIVEDSLLPTQHIRVANNDLHDNNIGGFGAPTGIFVHNSHNVVFTDNTARGNGQYGIHLDADSDLNRLFDNDFTGNPTPVLNQGSGNCGSGNSPNPFPPCP
jgi:parallel beta-helix repeat protein